VITDRDMIGTLSIIELITRAEQLDGAGRLDSAIELYNEWIRTAESPLKFVASFNLGVLYTEQQDSKQAIKAYEQALELNPDFIQARLNLGTMLEQLGRQDDALDQWRLALRSKEIEKPESKPLHLHALKNLGRLLEIQRRFKPALDMLEQSLALDVTQFDVMLHLIHLAQKICRWPIYAPPTGMTKDELLRGTSPLAMLAASDNPEAQLAVSKRFIEHKYPSPAALTLAPVGGYRHDRIRLGYLSSNLSTHAVSLLTVELFEAHDRGRFEVYGFCWSHEDGTAFRQRIINGFDRFIRIGALNDKEAAECIRSHEIDILVDLQGLTSGARPIILSYRPAPVQMTYLGFPGTTGLPWIDYVIADRYIIPEDEAGFYSEKPLYLPNCFQVSDSKRQIGATPKRADYNLPENSFVYCSFNHNYKYTPEMFSAWMRILKHVPRSVLWLLADNEWAQENLTRFALKSGIKKERLIFAQRVLPADYLARYQLADLFLDSYPFNGGTTANDALFMGLPLLTLSGRTFASRYAGSLLKNLNLPELIARNLKEYEEKAVRFAKHHTELRALKNRLIENKTSGPVFDSARLVRDLENQFELLLKEPHPPSQQIIKENVTRGGSKSNLPLVSILIPTHNRPDYFELALKSALAQTYENIEIIVSDNSDDELTRYRIATYLINYPSIRYIRVPGYSANDNWINCLRHASGEYINYLMDDDIYHENKISIMLTCMLTQPNIGLVTSFRQLIDANGNYLHPIPGTERLFSTRTIIKGVSLGEMILLNGRNVIGEPTTALVKRDDIGDRFGVFLCREYGVLSDVATWLSILSHKDCVYLPEPLSYFRIHAGQDQQNSPVKIMANIEWLQLFCDAHEHKAFLVNRSAIHEHLAHKLVTMIWFLSSEHQKIKEGAYELEKIHSVIRQATAILLEKP